MSRRVVIAAIAPNITLPIWARLFRRAILPVVDEARFIVGSPSAEMLELAQGVLSFAELDLRPAYQSHGHAVTELYRGIKGDADTLVLEDDCFVTCPPVFIDSCFARLQELGGVIGSRMARSLEAIDNRQPGGGLVGPDTFGDGLYPNMAFCSLPVLRANTDMDWTSRNRGDVGQCIGDQLHAAGLHLRPEAQLPQCRLSMYAGCVMVDPDTWKGPWLHVGEMSGIPRWSVGSPPPPRPGGHYEAVAAYAAALESGECHPGSELELMRGHVAWAESRPEYQAGRYPACKALLARVFASGRTSTEP